MRFICILQFLIVLFPKSFVKLYAWCWLPLLGESYVLCKFYTENKNTTIETDLGFYPAKFIGIFQFNASKSMTVFQFCIHIFILLLSFPSKL